MHCGINISCSLVAAREKSLFNYTKSLWFLVGLVLLLSSLIYNLIPYFYLSEEELVCKKDSLF